MIWNCKEKLLLVFHNFTDLTNLDLLQYWNNLFMINTFRNRIWWRNFLFSSLIRRHSAIQLYRIHYSKLAFFWSKNRIHVPLEKLEHNFSRSSGPGGQNVNKLNTKVELRFKVSEADWLADDVKNRLRHTVGCGYGTYLK